MDFQGVAVLERTSSETRFRPCVLSCDPSIWFVDLILKCRGI